MVRAKRKINIRDIFLGLQKQMRSKLSLNKKILTHPVTKGDASESEWINMLTSYLPSRYRADRAFVIDCEGNVSDQIDIVIYDRHYSPFILKQGGSTYIPAESVYAVIEVKPTLNKKNVEYASKKANSVRILKRTTATIVHAGEVTRQMVFNFLNGGDNRNYSSCWRQDRETEKAIFYPCWHFNDRWLFIRQLKKQFG